MESQYKPQKTAVQLGFWSAALTSLMTVLFFIAILISNQNLMYGSSFLLAPAFVALMVSIHHYAAPDQKIWSQLGLSFAIIYAVLCSLTYYIQLTFIRNNFLPVAEEALLPFVFIPGTPIFAQDMLGYVFMCAATLAAAPIFTGGKLERWIKWLLIFNGVLFIVPTILIPAIPLPVNATGTGIGNQVGAYANLVWAAYFATAMILVTVLFGRAQIQLRRMA